MQKIDNLFSVCEIKDLSTWKITSRYILKFIDSKNYFVIVPDSQVDKFQICTPREFQGVSENLYISNDIKFRLKKNTQSSPSSYNWYLQQFIKISALYNTQENQLNLIWDADTVPIKKLYFTDGSNLKFYIGSENHKPYFETTNRLLGYGKIANFSWISQCFTCRGYWIKHFISSIENKHSKNWADCLIDAIDFSVYSSFSEYETLGNFFMKNYPSEIIIFKRNWLRYGMKLLGSAKNLKYFIWFLRLKYDFVVFEKWDKNIFFELLKKLIGNTR